jgi:serine/threonine protein kinase
MAILAGERLGTYEVLKPIGAGGMGEVYRARDTKLKRDVAIKILPDEFSRDPNRVSHFQREAEVSAKPMASCRASATSESRSVMPRTNSAVA